MNNLAQSIGAPAPESASPAPPPVPAPPVSAAKGSPSPSPGTKQTPEVSCDPAAGAMPLETAPAPPVVPPFKTRALPLQEAAQPEPQPSTVERALEMPAAAHAAAAPKTRVIQLERSFGTLNPTSAGLAGGSVVPVAVFRSAWRSELEQQQISLRSPLVQGSPQELLLLAAPVCCRSPRRVHRQRGLSVA